MIGKASAIRTIQTLIGTQPYALSLIKYTLNDRRTNSNTTRLRNINLEI